MHNLHLCVVRAKNPLIAEDIVEAEIADWGNENNWRAICGSISEDDAVHVTGEGRFEPSDTDTVETINKMFGKHVREPYIGVMGTDCRETIRRTLAAVAADSPVEHDFDLYILEKYIHKLYENAINGLNKPDVVPNVFEHQYNAWTLDEFGVTHIGDPTQDAAGKRYVVFVDMHS